MFRQAHASVAAYCCWDGVSTSASQLDRRWLFEIFFSEKDGIYLLKASVLNAERADIFLQLDAAALFKRSTFVQHHEVVAQGEADFGYGGGFEQCDNRKGESGEIEAEKETMLFRRNLQ